MIEQVVQFEVSSLLKGFFLLFALHFIYDFQYHNRLTDFFLFFEEKLIHLDTLNAKKSATYHSVTSAIECYLK